MSFSEAGSLDTLVGADTSGNISLRRLRIDSANKAAGVHYGPVDPERFARAMQHVPKNCAFIDLGCGKGSCPHLGASSGTLEGDRGRILSALAKKARSNLTRSGILGDILDQDAATYHLPDEPCVIFMYNPFRPPVINSVIDNLVKHGRVFVIYVNPNHKDVLETTGKFAPR